MGGAVTIVVREMAVPPAGRDLVSLSVQAVYDFCPDRGVHFGPRKVLGDGVNNPGCAGVD